MTKATTTSTASHADRGRRGMNTTCPIWSPSPVVPHPDAELVALCMSFIALEEAASSAPSNDDDTPLQKEVMSKQSAMIGRIYEIRAQTVEGAVMRLRAAVAPIGLR